jgi:hypothetical protein
VSRYDRREVMVTEATVKNEPRRDPLGAKLAWEVPGEHRASLASLVDTASAFLEQPIAGVPVAPSRSRIATRAARSPRRADLD